MANSTNSTGVLSFFNGNSGQGQDKQGISIKAFALNIAVGLGLFAFELTGFLLLKSSGIGRRIYQPKTYLVQQRLRVEAIPVNISAWLSRIFKISDDELKEKCGLDGYFFIRLLRAMVIIFAPLMALLVTVLLPINYNGGKGTNIYVVSGVNTTFNVTGLDVLSWSNIAPNQTNRYWAHLICAVVAVAWTLFRIYREKVNFISVRQQFLTSPEHRLRASARTVLVTNIPSEYRSKEALETLYDVFVDNDDHSKLMIWVNRDYKPLRALVASRRKLRHALEKAELKILRAVNHEYRKSGDSTPTDGEAKSSSVKALAAEDEEVGSATNSEQIIAAAFEADCRNDKQKWRKYLNSVGPQISLVKAKDGSWQPVSSWKFWISGERKVPKIAWLREEIACLTVKIEELLQNLDDEEKFPRQNSAFIQFDRQMAAHMACSLASHHQYGRMTPRFVEVAPHEIVWPNMGVTSMGRLVKTVIALVLFAAMLFLWGLPTTFLGILSQLENLRSSTAWLQWLQPWPSLVISLISGPVVSILLALLVQLVVPALCRKLAVLIGSPTRSKRELVTQDFYFSFLIVELVLVTSISSGLIAVITELVANPIDTPQLLANNLPKAGNYFFNYIIIQALGYSGSVLFQYLRLLYITTIWPWFTQTPREEAFLQTTIPHQMWANVYSLSTNFAVIGLIYSVVSPLILIFVTIMFSAFWIVYRHNYYYVQRNKVDTYGLLFNNAMSQLFAGLYIAELALIGLFFLVRDAEEHVACTAQAIIMIVVLALTGIFHFVLEVKLRPLYELLPVTLEDPAVDLERQRFLTDGQVSDDEKTRVSDEGHPSQADSTLPPSDKLEAAKSPVSAKGLGHSKSMSATAVNARRSLLRLRKKVVSEVAHMQGELPETTNTNRRRQVADQLAAALESYPDELTDLSLEEREAELRAAFQDPVTREPPPVIWIPQDLAAISEDTIQQVKEKYGRCLQYSNAGAYLTVKNKCEVTQPPPDVRSDWLLDWLL